MIDENVLKMFWDDIPVGKENAVDYPTLCATWSADKRTVRAFLHELSRYDNGDDYILIRSSRCNGFYKTDDEEEIKAYKRECLNRGRNVFAPVRKINRVLNANTEQYSFENNLRVCREKAGKKQTEVCDTMQLYDPAFDVPLLSKMENGFCMPTPYQTILLAQIYGVESAELVGASYTDATGKQRKRHLQAKTGGVQITGRYTPNALTKKYCVCAELITIR